MKSCIALLAMCVVATSALHLTPDNFDEVTAGKAVFLKFYAPWCGHCKAMKPAWDSLMEAFKDSKDAVVAEVDCTAAGKPLCDSNGVQGFPTVKHGDPAALEDYQGGRTLDDLTKFAEENLKPSCSPSNIELCDDDKKAEIAKITAMSDDDLASDIKAKEDELSDAEKLFESEVEKLQTKYKSLMEEKDATLKSVKESGLGLMKAVQAHKAKAADAKDEL